MTPAIQTEAARLARTVEALEGARVPKARCPACGGKGYFLHLNGDDADTARCSACAAVVTSLAWFMAQGWSEEDALARIESGAGFR